MLAPESPAIGIDSLAPGKTGRCLVPLVTSKEKAPAPGTAPSPNLQLAFKSNATGIVYAQAPTPLHVVYSDANSVDKKAFLQAWKSLPDTSEASRDLPSAFSGDADDVVQALELSNVFTVARRANAQGETVVYAYARTDFDTLFLAEVTLRESLRHRVSLKTQNLQAFEALFMHSIHAILNP